MKKVIRSKGERINAATEDTTLRKDAERVADDVDDIVARMSRVYDIDGYLNKDELAQIGEVADMLHDFAQMYSHKGGNV